MCHATIQEDRDYIKDMGNATILGFKAANENKDLSSNPYSAYGDFFPYWYAWSQGWEAWQDRLIPKDVGELFVGYNPERLRNIQSKFLIEQKLDASLEKLLEKFE